VQSDTPTLPQIVALLGRLALAFGRQKEHDGASATDTARLYHNALRDLPMPAIESGVERIIREDRYWPRASRIRAAALPFVPTPPALESRALDHPVCPVGHRYQLAGYRNANGRLLGDRWWCRCEDRVAAVYGATWERPSERSRERAA